MLITLYIKSLSKKVVKRGKHENRGLQENYL